MWSRTHHSRRGEHMLRSRWIRGLLATAALAGLACGAPGEIITWTDSLADTHANATEGMVIEFSCPGGGQTGATVWGTDLYTDDSAICAAAVHAGKIGTYSGGSVSV